LFALHRHDHAGRDSDYVNVSAFLKNGFGQDSAECMSTWQSRYEQLEMVATRVIAATGLFYFARSIGSQASVGAAVDEERWAGKTYLPASLVLVQSEQFEASKSVGYK